MTSDTLSRAPLLMFTRRPLGFSIEMKRLPEDSSCGYPATVKRQLPKLKELAPLLTPKKPRLNPRHGDSPTRTRSRPQGHRQAAHSPSSLRLHGWGSRGRAVADACPSGIRGHRVPSGDPARRRPDQHVVGCARRTRGLSVRDRPDRLHPDDARRGRTCRRGGSRCRRDTVLTVDGRNHLHRDVKAANPNGRNWFQPVHVERSWIAQMALLDRAAACGFDTLLITVDVLSVVHDFATGAMASPFLRRSQRRPCSTPFLDRVGGSTSSPPSR